MCRVDNSFNVQPETKYIPLESDIRGSRILFGNLIVKLFCNLNFAISLIANSLNFNSAHYYILRNRSMIAYIVGTQN